MTKVLLSLLLVMTQLHSWSGPSLWLCICGSGQTCIVADPQTCNCCQGQHPAGMPCGDYSEDQPGMGDGCPSDRADLQVCEPFGCPHFQLSQHQGVAVASAKFAADAARLIPFLAEIAGLASVVDGSVCDGSTAVIWLPHAPKSSLTDLAHVVLRC